MSAEESDGIEIPIEISTQDKRDLEKIKREVEEIEKKTKKIKDESSRQAVPTIDEEQRGGIFGGEPKIRGKTLPIDTGSVGAPVKRENEFRKLRDQVKTLQDAQVEQTSALNQLFGGNFVGSNAQSKLGAVSGLAGGLSGGGGGLLKSLAGNLVPFLIPVLIGFGLVTTITNELFRPGGLFDRRFKREVQNEIASSTERGLKALIRQGRRVVRLTAFAGFRGGGVSTNLRRAQLGTPQFSQDFEITGKGL